MCILRMRLLNLLMKRQHGKSDSVFDFDGSDDFTEHNGLVWLTKNCYVNCVVIENIHDGISPELERVPL